MGSPIPENMLDGAEFSDSDSLETGVAGPMLRPSLDEEESGIVLQVPGPTCHLPLSPPERGTRSRAPTPPTCRLLTCWKPAQPSRLSQQGTPRSSGVDLALSEIRSLGSPGWGTMTTTIAILGTVKGQKIF